MSSDFRFMNISSKSYDCSLPESLILNPLFDTCTDVDFPELRNPSPNLAVNLDMNIPGVVPSRNPASYGRLANDAVGKGLSLRRSRESVGRE